MHILHYINHVDLAAGGGVRAVLDMCTWQARAGARVTLATFDPSGVPAAWLEGKDKALPRVVRLPAPGAVRGLMSKGLASSVEPLLREADVMHMHDIWDPAAITISRTARRVGKPYVQSPHGMLADWSVQQKRLKKAVYWTFFCKELIDHASFIVLTAEGELAQSAKRHPKTPGVSIPLVFDLDPYRAAPTPELARANLKLPPEDKPSVLYLSRLHYKKRPDLVLTAGRAMRDAGHDFRIVFAGPSDAEYDAKLRTYAKELKVDDITTFLGMVPAEWKPSLYHGCDVFCLPTSMENFGFVYFEALASATAVVTTKGTDTWKEIEGSGGGRIVEMIASDVQDGQVGGGDVRQLASVLGDLVKDRDLMERMGQAGRRWVFEHMEPAVVVKQYLDMYAQAAKNGPRP